MTDPALDPSTELDEHPQDPGVPEPAIPLRRLLGWLRVGAGDRGFAIAAWSDSGFRYSVLVQREPPTPASVDLDPHLEPRVRDALLARMRAALRWS